MGLPWVSLQSFTYCFLILRVRFSAFFYSSLFSILPYFDTGISSQHFLPEFIGHVSHFRCPYGTHSAHHILITLLRFAVDRLMYMMQMKWLFKAPFRAATGRTQKYLMATLNTATKPYGLPLCLFSGALFNSHWFELHFAIYGILMMLINALQRAIYGRLFDMGKRWRELLYCRFSLPASLRK